MKSAFYARKLRRSIRREKAALGSPPVTAPQVTHAEAAGIITAVLSLASFSIAERRLARQTSALARSWQSLVDARVRLLRMQSMPTVGATRAAQEQLHRDSLTPGGAWRLVRAIPVALLATFDLVLLAFDWTFFNTLYRDLADIPSSEMLSSGSLMAAAGAMATPLMVFGAAYGLAHLLATRIAWPDKPLNGLRLALAVASTALVAVLVAVFAGAAGFRFQGESSAIGGASAPVWVLATIFGLLPAAAALLHGLAINPVKYEFRRIDRMRGADSRAEIRLQDEAQKSCGSVAAARQALEITLAALFTRADAQLFLAHRIIAEERARSGRAGLLAAFAPGISDDGHSPVLALDVACPPRVARLVDHALEILNRCPAAGAGVEEAVRDQAMSLGIEPMHSQAGLDDEPRITLTAEPLALLTANGHLNRMPS